MINHYDLYSIESFNSVKEICEKEYDIFISAYNNENIVQDVFREIFSKQKVWLIFPDYENLDNSIYSKDEFFEYGETPIDYNKIESMYINNFLQKYNMNERTEESVCIDLTGFIKPYMIYLLLALNYLKFNKLDIIYSEPKSYINNEETSFSINETKSIRSIAWNELRVDHGKNDLLFINVGYDNKLVDNIVNQYKYVDDHKILIGFPSLQPIMYQENMLNFIKSAENLNITHTFQPIYASANDPFDSAKIIDEEVEKFINEKDDVKIVYLAPLATKAQALGIVLFYIKEYKKFESKGVTLKIVYPFTKSYSLSSSTDFSKINRYILEFN